MEENVLPLRPNLKLGDGNSVAEEINNISVWLGFGERSEVKGRKRT